MKVLGEWEGRWIVLDLAKAAEITVFEDTLEINFREFTTTITWDKPKLENDERRKLAEILARKKDEQCVKYLGELLKEVSEWQTGLSHE